MRVLIIEDDPIMTKNIQLILQSKGFVCDTTTIGEDGLGIARHYDYDIILLDIMLPDMDGYEILRRLRAVNISTPVLILSGLSEIDDKIKGLGFGADDYLTKPFNKDELLARVQAIVRRSKGHANSVITIGKLEVDTNLRTITANGKQVVLTAREYAILELLAIRKGATLSKENFLNHLYGGMEEPEAKIIDVFICKLRKKLELYLDGENYIETVWGRGYVLREPSKDDGINTYSHLQPSASMPRPLKPQSPMAPKPMIGQHRQPVSPLKNAQTAMQKPVIGGHRPVQASTSSPIQTQTQSTLSKPTASNPYRPSASLSQSMPSNMQKPIVGVQRPASSSGQPSQVKPINAGQKSVLSGQQSPSIDQRTQTSQQSNIQPSSIKRASS